MQTKMKIDKWKKLRFSMILASDILMWCVVAVKPWLW